MGVIQDINENYYTGWIKIFRSIRDHWIWKDPEKLQWWIDLLLEVNHEDKKIAIGYDIFECSRGQSLNSLLTWAKRWNTNKSKVIRFLSMLQKDDMIRIENVKKTTRITVCNYGDYQGVRNESETQTKRKRNANEHKQELKNYKNIRIEDSIQQFKDEVKQYSNEYQTEMLKAFFEYWSEPTVKKDRMRKDLEKTWDTKRRLNTWYRRGNGK